MTAAAAESTAMVPAPEAPLPVPAPQFARGFDGMASEPFPETARRVLAEPVNPHDVEIKPDGIVFLPGVAYRRILTRAFGAGGWAIAPRSPARYMKDNNIVVYHGALFCLGRFVAEAVGECFYRDNNPNMSYASCVEGAKTDALSRCCKDLGIATEMWDANWREQWKAKYATSYEDRNSGKTKWKLKSRVSNPHDLMAGAGGVAPPAATSSPASSASTGSSRTTSSAAAAGPAPSPSPSSQGAPPDPQEHAAAPETERGTGSTAAANQTQENADPGEAASNEQKDALRAKVRELKWTRGYMRLWFKGLFGPIYGEGDPLEKLTQRQADTAYFLVLAHGKPLYDKLLADEKAKGNVLP
jgi:hypothetical protein